MTSSCNSTSVVAKTPSAAATSGRRRRAPRPLPAGAKQPTDRNAENAGTPFRRQSRRAVEIRAGLAEVMRVVPEDVADGVDQLGGREEQARVVVVREHRAGGGRAIPCGRRRALIGSIWP